MTRNVKIMSVSINLGQVNRSTEIAINGIVNDTRIDLTPKIKRLLVKIIIERKTSIKFNIKKANCHPLPKKNLNIAMINTGTV